MTETQLISARAKSVNLAGIEYLLEFRNRMPRTRGSPTDGWWHRPKEGAAGHIILRSSLEGQSLLDALIHEAMHATLPDLPEQAVDKSASDIARMLWQLGFRLSI